MLHRPPQQSPSAVHESPACPQKDEGAQTPPEQNAEQHCEFCVHTLPSVLQPVFSVEHVPEEHMPLQHCVLPVQACPSVWHAGMVHTPPLQFRLQQSLAFEQTPPVVTQPPPPPPPPPPPHLLNPPPPQYCGAVHVPQLS